MKNSPFKISTVLSAFFLLTGCASPYQPSGFRGGYTDMALNRDTYFVAFRGNGFTSSDVVQSYVLRRSAELTRSKGYQYFVIINSGTQASSQIVKTPTTIHTQSFDRFHGSGYGNTSFHGSNAFSDYHYSGYGNASSDTTINPGSEYEIKRFKSGATIKMLHTNKGYPQAFDAAIILSNYQE